MDWRFDAFLDGDDLGSAEWSLRLQGLVGSMVDSGLLESADWLLPGLSLAEKAEMIPRLRAEISSKMWSRVGVVRTLEFEIVEGVIGKVCILVVQMAALAFSAQIGFEALPEYFEGSKWRKRTADVEKRVANDRRRFLTPLIWFTPEAHLEVAKLELEEARKEVRRAHKRINDPSLASEREDLIKPLPHKASVLDQKAVDRLRKRLAFRRDGLFAELESNAAGHMHAVK